MSKKRVSLTGWLLVGLCAAAGIFIASCTMFNYEEVSLMPLTIPGAEYVGSASCAMCHETQYKYFQLSEHATVALKTSEDEEPVQAEGCETCHGPGSLHIEGGGDKSKVLRANEKTCFSCHLDIRGKFQLQHHHPVPEGQMSCSDCHSMHGSDVRATGGLSLQGKDEKCFKCHKEQKGPFVFEHDAMREGCRSCHNPHGSVYDKLLVAGQTTTCLRCHWQVNFNQPAGFLGGVPHGGYYIGQGEECIDHHRAPHGSNIWRTFNR